MPDRKTRRAAPAKEAAEYSPEEMAEACAQFEVAVTQPAIPLGEAFALAETVSGANMRDLDIQAAAVATVQTCTPIPPVPPVTIPSVPSSLCARTVHIFASDGADITSPSTVVPRSPRQCFEDEKWFRARLDAHFALEGKWEEWNGGFRPHATLEWMERCWHTLLSMEERDRADAAVIAAVTGASILRAAARRKGSSARSRSAEKLLAKVRSMKADGYSQLEMCRQLAKDGNKTPKHAAWDGLGWVEAYMSEKHKKAVKKWLSKAAAQVTQVTS